MQQALTFDEIEQDLLEDDSYTACTLCRTEILWNHAGVAAGGVIMCWQCDEEEA